MMKRLMLLVLAVLALAACAQKIPPNELALGISTGSLYYTQFSLFEEKNTFRTTNYRKGVLIPINTPATLISIDSKHIELRLVDTGQPLTIENVQKHTGDDVQQAFKKILGKTRADLSRFTQQEQQNIRNGQVAKGMGRKAVLAAIGYPPITETRSLQSNDWTYWSSRFDRFIVHFKHDRVEAITD